MKMFSKNIDLTGKVAIVTGAGQGLGKAHALLLASRGAKVVVNDLGTASDGVGETLSQAHEVVAEITKLGGTAITNGANVTNFDEVQSMVDEVIKKWGRVDILVNNAGILRDKSFSKQSLEDFKAVVDVHLWGAVNCTKCVWDIMKKQEFGRIVMTTSSSGLYGNFGQAAYGAAKMALVGLMNTLHEEGAKYNVRVNCLAPSAATRMTENILSPEQLKMLVPDVVAHGVLALVSDDAPSKFIMCAGAGSFERAHITMTRGKFIGNSNDAAEQVLANIEAISDRVDENVPSTGFMQPEYEQTVLKQVMQQRRK